MNDNLQTSTTGERKIGAGNVAVLAVMELRQAAYDSGFEDGRQSVLSTEGHDLSAVGLAQLIAELAERSRQAAYDDGYGDGQSAAREDAQ